MPPKSILAQGYRYELANNADTVCSNCGNVGVPVLRPSAFSSIPTCHPPYALCEPCTLLISWGWSQVSGDTTGPAPPWSSAAPSVACVLIVRENLTNVQSPFELLAVARKDEPSAYAMPGGKIEFGESPEQAAVRELREETGLITWPGTLETLYVGHSMRGRVVQVFLCRGYYGAPFKKETEVAWKAWPPEKSMNYAPGFHRGVTVSFQYRLRIQQFLPHKMPMSLSLSRPAFECCQLRRELQVRVAGFTGKHLSEEEEHQLASDREMIRCFVTTMSTMETSVLEMVSGPIDAAAIRARASVAPEAIPGADRASRAGKVAGATGATGVTVVAGGGVQPFAASRALLALGKGKVEEEDEDDDSEGEFEEDENAPPTDDGG